MIVGGCMGLVEAGLGVLERKRGYKRVNKSDK